MNRKAFTLIELLVTIVLFSLLLMTALYSFRFVSINIRHINNTNPQKAINFDLLRNVISSMYYYVATDENQKNINKKFYYFFNGNDKECFFITMSPLFSQNLSMVHIYYKDSKLWYEEGKLFKRGVDYLNLSNIPLNKGFILFDDIKNIKISYITNGKREDKLLRKIPNMVEMTIYKQQTLQEKYFFTVKSDNYKNLSIVIKRGFEQ